MKFEKNIKLNLCDIEQQRSFQVLSKLYAEGHFPHAILLVSSDPLLADKVVEHFANKILDCDDCQGHLDFFTIGPSGAGSQIIADDMRALISAIQMSPRVSRAKVAHVRHAEAMNKCAANSFLMTLEEPPNDTIIFLSTTNKYDILPTILSRCIAFKFHSKLCHTSAILEKITNMYESWLNALNAETNSNLKIIEMYKMLSCIDDNFNELAEELAVTNSELAKILIANLEQKTIKVFRDNPRIVLKLHKVIEIFENSKYFLSLNCNIIAYLERCLILVTRFFEKNQKKAMQHDNGR
ncbi:MAG: hypothetical protein LBB15_00540 [Puniceicoccales bacterium]|jgi:DNA polymerase III delta prime subunit|nr:hypothetical protein [Puniceicoccales bacterium]